MSRNVKEIRDFNEKEKNLIAKDIRATVQKVEQAAVLFRRGNITSSDVVSILHELTGILTQQVAHYGELNMLVICVDNMTNGFWEM